MKVIYIDGYTNVLGAPQDWNPETNGECFGLPVRQAPYGDTVEFTSAWQPSPDELAALAGGAPILLRVVGGHPPVSIHVEGVTEDLEAPSKPDGVTVPPMATPYMIESMTIFAQICLETVGKIDVALIYATGVQAAMSERLMAKEERAA